MGNKCCKTSNSKAKSGDVLATNIGYVDPSHNKDINIEIIDTEFKGGGKKGTYTLTTENLYQPPIPMKVEANKQENNDNETESNNTQILNEPSPSIAIVEILPTTSIENETSAKMKNNPLDTSTESAYRLNVLRKTFKRDFQTFLLNNILLSLQFENERELMKRAQLTLLGHATSANTIDTRQNEVNSRLLATKHNKKAICPDALHEQLSTMVRFSNPAHSPGAAGVPLHPIRLLICHDDIDIIDSGNTHSSKSTDDLTSKKLQLHLEESSHIGYVKLREHDEEMDAVDSDSDDDLYASGVSEISTVIGTGKHRLSDISSDCGGDNPTVEIHEKSSISKIPIVIEGPDKDENDNLIQKSERRRKKSQRPMKKQYPILLVPAGKNSNSSNDSSGYRSGSILANPPSIASTSSESEYGYSTISLLNTSLTLLEKRKSSKNTGVVDRDGYPQYCFAPVMFKCLTEGEYPSSMFQTRHYLSSSSFIDHFCNIFAEYLGPDLGFAPVTINGANVRGATITCQSTHQKLDIMPAISCTCPMWPTRAIEWIHRNPKTAFHTRKNIPYYWPTKEMKEQVRQLGYVLTPQGFAPRRGNNANFNNEWTIEFPEGEKYLESCLNHVQLRSYIFCLIIYQAFFKIPDALTENHLRHIIFWLCENLIFEWPNYEMHNNLNAVFNFTYDALSKGILQNYFIKKKNELLGIAKGKLYTVQEAVHNYRENPVGHVIAALKCVILPNNPYPVLNYDKLLEILKTQYPVHLINPALGGSSIPKPIPPNNTEQRKSRRGSEYDSDRNFWNSIKNPQNDPQKAWNEKFHKILTEEKQKKLLEEQIKSKKLKALEDKQSKKPKIEINISKGKFQASPIRRRLVLELFIDHFLNLSTKAIELKLRSSARDFIIHAEHLFILLNENGDYDEQKNLQTLKQLRELKQMYSNIPVTATVFKHKRYSKTRSNNERKPLALPKDADVERDVKLFAMSTNWHLSNPDSDISGTHSSADIDMSPMWLRIAPPSILKLTDELETEYSTDL